MSKIALQRQRNYYDFRTLQGDLGPQNVALTTKIFQQRSDFDLVLLNPSGLGNFKIGFYSIPDAKPAFVKYLGDKMTSKYSLSLVLNLLILAYLR